MSRQPHDQPARPVAFELLHMDVESGVDSRERRVLRSTDEWASWWHRLVSKQFPARPLPVVDFERDMLILATMGTRGSTGYFLTPEAVEETETVLRVRLVSSAPGDNCPTLCVMTSPAIVLRVPRHSGEVEFVETERE